MQWKPLNIYITLTPNETICCVSPFDLTFRVFVNLFNWLKEPIFLGES